MERHATRRGRLVVVAGAFMAILALTQSAGGAPPAAPAFGVPDTMSTVRGTVRDSAGHPLDSIEVYVMTSGQSARTDAAGRYFLSNLLDGPTRLRVRHVGWKPVDTVLVLERRRSMTVDFRLTTRVSLLDTIRVSTSQDNCAPRNFYGFNCRRRAGVGVFRDSAELAALKPDWDADLFDGIPGLRRDGHDVKSVTGWRCLGRLINGRPPSPIDIVDFNRTDWAQHVRAIEFYAHGDDVPAWYRIYAFAEANRTQPAATGQFVRGGAINYRQPSLPGRSCALIVYWTK
jgi:hypothetical protein